MVYQKQGYRADSDEQLASMINMEASRLKQIGGMIITLDDDVKSKDFFGNSKFVPMHMFAFITFEVKRLASPMPDPEAEGVVLQ